MVFHERFRGHGVRWPALKANFGCAENIGGAAFTDPDGALVVELGTQRQVVLCEVREPPTASG